MSAPAQSPVASVGRRLSQLSRIDVEELNGVGPRKASALRAMEIESVLDLVTHYPRRYADRTNAVAIGHLQPGEEAVVSGRIRRLNTRRPRGRRAIVELVVDDQSGHLVVSFFNQPWRAKQLEVGTTVVVFGKVDSFRGRLQMVNPIVDLVGDRTGRIVPIYPQSEKAGIGSTDLASFIAEALDRAGEFADPLPDADRRALGMLTRTEAFRSIHAPERLADREPARRRLAFDELFRLEMALVLKKRAAAARARGIAHRVEPSRDEVDLVTAFVEGLPFSLTAAQQRVLKELAKDLADALPMHRLLQGDVGSGKTVVALGALLYGVQGGYQGAFMVPTEVLAEQHYLLARRLLGGLVVEDEARLTGTRQVLVALLTSRTPGAARRRLLGGLRNGSIDLLIGTHALLTEGVRFDRLGVVVIDEQHRFGVDQRAALREKGSAEGEDGHDPDLLVMTATPIPRTAAMTVYGDLDYSVLDELPPGRAPVETRWVTTEGEDAVWSALRDEVSRGRQGFVVCPLVRPGDAEETGASVEDAAEEAGRLFGGDVVPRRPPRAAVEEVERLRSGPLAGLRLGLLHGQLGSREKDEVMSAFRDGRLDVLVATTVVEVGVDVPAATVMVIEDADRFGIAQLHQLRGRVGRGSDPAWCYLLADEVAEVGERRLQALCASTDGFELAEVDLELRGEGTVLGARQKGRSDLRLASLRRDRELVDAARRVAESIVARDPGLEQHPLLADELALFIGEEAEYLLRS